MGKILFLILFLELSELCFCDGSQKRPIIQETDEEHLMCFDFHGIGESFENLFDGQLSVYNRDNIARLIILIDEFYGAYHEYQWVLNTALKSSMVLMPGGPAIPLVVNITLELMMHPKTQRAIDRALYRSWKNVKPTGDEQYAVQRNNGTVIVEYVTQKPTESMESTEPTKPTESTESTELKELTEPTESQSNESAFDKLMGFLPHLSIPEKPQQNQSGQNDSQSNVIIKKNIRTTKVPLKKSITN